MVQQQILGKQKKRSQLDKPVFCLVRLTDFMILQLLFWKHKLEVEYKSKVFEGAIVTDMNHAGNGSTVKLTGSARSTQFAAGQKRNAFSIVQDVHATILRLLKESTVTASPVTTCL